MNNELFEILKRKEEILYAAERKVIRIAAELKAARTAKKAANTHYKQARKDYENSINK